MCTFTIALSIFRLPLCSTKIYVLFDFLNCCVIRQYHHSNLKAMSVQRIWLYLHEQCAPTEKVRSSRMS